MLRTSLARFRDVVRTVGLRRSLLLLPGSLLRTEFSVLVGDLEGPPPAQPSAGSRWAALRWTPMSERDVPRLLELNPGITGREVQGWLDDGHECMLARLDGELVHYRSYVTGRVALPYLGATLQLDEGDILIGQLYTLPRLRRGGLLAAAGQWSQRYVRAAGHRRMVSLVADWNVPTLRTSARFGLGTVGSVRAWRLGPWRRTSIRGRLSFDAAGDLRLPPSGRPPADR